MKVGTDGCLLGAWAYAQTPQQILDIGAGTGLVALMLAQRYPKAKITALEIEPTCAQQCAENIKNSPFAQAIKTENCALQKHTPTAQYDLIVSNPPYFSQAFLPTNLNRSTARHDNLLPAKDLFCCAEKMLAESGKICIVIPTNRETDFCLAAKSYQLNLQQKVLVKPTPAKPAKRVLLKFGRESTTLKSSEMVVEISRGKYSEEFQKLLSNFYLYL